MALVLGVWGMNINLYLETVEILGKHNKTLKDIQWVGTEEASIDKDRFFEEAKKIEYDNGYGGTYIATDLIIVGADWWLSRGEYDGSEWWAYNILPQRPKMQGTKFDLRVHSLFGYVVEKQ
jgi:hypothetical protein